MSTNAWFCCNKTLNTSLSDEDFSLWAIYKLISRLKVKIKKYFEIINHKGNGYILQKIDLQGLNRTS